MSLFQLIEANQEQMDKITERFNERLDKVFRKINRMAQAEIVAYDIDDTLEFDLIWADILEDSGYNNLVQRYVNTLDDMQGSINKILDEAGLLETLSKDQINRLRAVKELQIKDLQKIGTDAGLSLKKSLYNNVLAGKSKSELLEAMEGELAGTRYQSYAKTYASTGISDYRQAVINQRTEEFADDEDVVWVYEGNDADKVTRDFCRHILKANKAYDKGEKDKLESDKRRKWNCRHMFVPMYKEDALEAGYNIGVTTKEQKVTTKEQKISKNIAQDGKIIGKGNTGSVYLVDNKVYKNFKENELEAYEIMKDNPFVISANKKGEFLETDYYPITLTQEDIIKASGAKQKAMIGFIDDNRKNINKTINDLSSKGISYSDQLQFVYDKKKKEVKLFDFSNAMINRSPSLNDRADLISRNSTHLTNYYNAVGLEKEAKKISNARVIYTNSTVDSSWLLDEKDIKTFGLTVEDTPEQISAYVTKTLGEGEKKYIYWQRDARDISLNYENASIADGKSKFIVLNKKLTDKEIESNEWEFVLGID